MNRRRLRLKSSLTADRTWAADNVDPNTFAAELGGTTADGIYAIDVIPEDGSATISVEFEREAAEDDGAIGDELADVGTALIATTLAPYLRSIESDAAGVLTLVSLPTAEPFRVELRAPGGATFELDVDEVWPITELAAGKGELFIEFVATDGGVPLAPGSGNVDVQLLSVIDRRRPTGRRVTAPDDALAVTATAEVETHPLGEPLVAPSPPGLFTVAITGVASLPAGTDALEVWVGLTGA